MKNKQTGMSSDVTPSSRATTTSSELESEEMTVPTDLTLSLAEESGDCGGDAHPPRTAKTQITKQLYERKQLLHDLQLIKIELSQKTLIIDNMKAEYMSKTEELEEKLAETQHQKQILQSRLESELRIQEDEMRRHLEQNKIEMNKILIKQKELEERNGRLQEKACEIRSSLSDLELNDEQYLELQSQDLTQLSLKSFIAVKVYEMKWPLRNEVEHLKVRLKVSNDERKMSQSKYEQISEDLDRERQHFAQILSKYNRAVTELETVKSELRSGDYRVENYDKIKNERDKLMEDHLETKTIISALQATKTNIEKELEDLKSEKLNLKQKVSLLEQDKEFLNKRFLETNSRAQELEERLTKSTMQLEKANQAREDFYERYVSARDFYKSEFEKKLREELDSIQMKMTSEIEVLRRTTREMNEQELRSLKDARDLAISQREKSETAERQTLTKYERLIEEIRKTQNEDGAQLSNLRSQLTLKTFELEQTKVVHGETQTNFQQMQLENEKLDKKVQLLNSEFHEMRNKLQKRISELESQTKDKSSKLSVYEKLEEELDDVVVQAAEIADYADGEKILLSFGREMGVPTTIRRRLQQSFQLAKRILQLEKLNITLKKELESNDLKVQDLLEEINNCKELLRKVKEPHSDMIATVQSRDDVIKRQKHNITDLEDNIKILNKEKDEILNKNDVLAKELEKALSNREEVAKMKQLLMTLFPNRFVTNEGAAVATDVQRAPAIRPTGLPPPPPPRSNTATFPKATIFSYDRPVAIGSV